MKPRSVDLRVDTWILPEVRVLGTTRERYTGVGADTVTSVMLLTRSIHTFTMRTSLLIMVLDLHGIVVGAEVVPPRRIVRFSEMVWVVETQADVVLPMLGTQVIASTMAQRCLEH